MGWASYQEDNIDARGESKSSKSRKPEVPNRDKPPARRYTSHKRLRNHIPIKWNVLNHSSAYG